MQTQSLAFVICSMVRPAHLEYFLLATQACVDPSFG
jgi:hypothetical protein